MSTIPTSITEEQFNQYVRPNISVAKRGFECQIPLHKVFNYILYRLHTGCQWHMLPIDAKQDDPSKKEISHDAVAYHYRKWCRDDSLKTVWQQSVLHIEDGLDLSQLHIDGTHTQAKNGGDEVAYQRRKRSKTSNLIPLTDANGAIIASTDVIAGNHNDAWQLKKHLQQMFKDVKQLGLSIKGANLNGDPAFDTKDARKTCFNHGVYPNIKENKRNRKKLKRGPKRQFDAEAYKCRFTIERTFAWVDKFRAVLLRFDRDDDVFLGANHLAFAMINLRHLLSPH